MTKKKIIFNFIKHIYGFKRIAFQYKHSTKKMLLGARAFLCSRFVGIIKNKNQVRNIRKISLLIAGISFVTDFAMGKKIRSAKI
ncbi:MAG: hypothetical protein A2283_17465 [Lentisphaerae bacterium RIFOXYA12_FULL_48_11]|nr:MAG: hypothetical protein A2259_01630 [Candidatus Moranbacteria bacterium RIFOXYA2_FULL_43_15]OGV68342.1 MAG: hypothetical protein A2283_17465 [Lentisphaerae bacterium RIFOXYA12_FULL_48_11]